MIAVARRRDRLLAGLLVVGSWLWLVQAHWQQVDLPKSERKAWLHERVLANEAADPYQYKLWLVSEALEALRHASGESLERVFLLNTLLSLAFLVWAHQRWLRSLAGGGVALVGAWLLAALAHPLFLLYYHHPYEFWGVAAFCLLLRGVQRDVDWRWLALGCLLTGLVWEKHALLAPLWGVLGLGRRRPFLRTFGQGLVLLAAALAVPLLVRWHLGTDRGHVDGDTPWALQQWSKVLWFQVPYVVPFLLAFLVAWRDLPAWVRWLWLYLPALGAAYASQDYILHEVRSFWALAPVFTATVCCWLAARQAAGGGADPSPAQAPG